MSNIIIYGSHYGTTKQLYWLQLDCQILQMKKI